MNDDEIEKLLKRHSHLKKYLDSISRKMKRPVFYSVLPTEVKDEEYPNLIYPGQGSIFIHVYRTRDMDEKEYHTIEPKLDKNEQIKHDKLQKLIIKNASKKQSVITDDQLKELNLQVIKNNDKK